MMQPSIEAARFHLEDLARAAERERTARRALAGSEGTSLRMRTRVGRRVVTIGLWIAGGGSF